MKNNDGDSFGKAARGIPFDVGKKGSWMDASRVGFRRPCGGQCLSRTILGLVAVLAVSSVLVSPVFAQGRIGFWAGSYNGTLAGASDEDVEISKRTGLSIGTFYENAFNENASLQFRAGYIEKGVNLRYTDVPISGDLALKYIETAILLKIGFGDEGFQPYLMVGPTLSYLTEATSTAHATVRGRELEDTVDLSSYVNDSDFGFDLGAGIRVKWLFVGVSYKLGLSNVVRDATDELSNRGFEWMAGLSVPIR